MTKPRLLWLGLEPTPYLLALQSRAREQLSFGVETVFERQDASQPWALPAVGYTVAEGVVRRVSLLLRVLRRSYRAVFLEGWGTSLLVGAGLAALAAGVPLVVSGDTWQEAGTRGFGDLRRRLRRQLLRRASATLPGGSPQRTFFLSEGACPDRSIVRQMTVDVETLRQRAADLAPGRADVRGSFGLPRDLVVALTVARLVPEKGLDLLLRAVSGIGGLQLLVVGDGPQRAELEELGTRLGVSDRVIWAGRLSHDDVVRAYVAADFFVLPSRFEPWGLVVNEAMACGLPVVVSAQVGCADDLIAGTGAGLVVRAEDVTGLRDALAEVAGDVALRRRAAGLARKVISRWTTDEEIAAIRRALTLALPA